MSKTLNKKGYFRFLAMMLMLTAFLPLAYNNLPPIIGSSRYLWSPLWIISLLVLTPKIFSNKYIIYLIAYGLIFLIFLMNSIWFQIRDWDRAFVRNEFVYIFVALTVLYYFLTVRDIIGLSLITKWAIIFIGITAVMSIYSSIIDPMYARKLIGGSYTDVSELNLFKRLGGGEYSFASTLVCLFPMMIYYYKNNKLSIYSKKTILLFGLLCFITLLRMQIIANILMSVVIILLSLLGSKRIKKSLFFIIIISIVLILLPISFYINLLTNVSRFFDSDSHIYFKLTDMVSYLNPSDLKSTGIDARASRYPLLIASFLENPFLGYYVTRNIKDIGDGGHLYWMNKLTIFGLLGFIPFLLIHYYYIKRIIKLFDQTFLFYFLLSVASVIGMGLMKNLAGRTLWFTYFIILPGMFFLPLLRKRNMEHNYKLK